MDFYVMVLHQLREMLIVFAIYYAVAASRLVVQFDSTVNTIPNETVG